MESFPPSRPRQELAPKELVISSLEQLDGEAQEALYAVQSLTADQEDFVLSIAAFNALPAEARGKGRYDHGRPLTEHIDREEQFTSPKGYPYAVTLHKNGEITLATPLS